MNTCQLGNSSSATLALQLNFFQPCKQNKKKFKNSRVSATIKFFIVDINKMGVMKTAVKMDMTQSMSNADRRPLEKLSLVDVVQEKCSGVNHTALFLVNVDQ